jgi:protein-S-isoprenylcysteine O-methyltransferase Ste14
MIAARLAAGVLLNVAFFGVSLFLPAGTLDWWRAWVIVGLAFLGAVGATVSLSRGHRSLLEERMKLPVQPGQPVADRILLLLLVVTFIGSLVFTSLDVFRLHVMPRPGPLVSSAGLLMFAGGWWLEYLALRENAFAAAVVRLQEERNHSVIATGVYSIVRHPMYAGGIALIVGLPLWLESYAGAMLAGLSAATLIVRIFFEERFLRRELAGYAAYTERVRYRLIPFLW